MLYCCLQFVGLSRHNWHRWYLSAILIWIACLFLHDCLDLQCCVCRPKFCVKSRCRFALTLSFLKSECVANCGVRFAAGARGLQWRAKFRKKNTAQWNTTSPILVSTRQHSKSHAQSTKCRDSNVTITNSWSHKQVTS